MNPKVTHVVRSKQNRYHLCHWPGCTEQVTPAKWGCKKHWYTLPQDIRNKIWRAYNIGQENNSDLVSRAYVYAAREAREWILRNYPDE